MPRSKAAKAGAKKQASISAFFKRADGEPVKPLSSQRSITSFFNKSNPAPENSDKENPEVQDSNKRRSDAVEAEDVAKNSGSCGDQVAATEECSSSKRPRIGEKGHQTDEQSKENANGADEMSRSEHNTIQSDPDPGHSKPARRRRPRRIIEDEDESGSEDENVSSTDIASVSENQEASRQSSPQKSEKDAGNDEDDQEEENETMQQDTEEESNEDIQRDSEQTPVKVEKVLKKSTKSKAKSKAKSKSSNNVEPYNPVTESSWEKGAEIPFLEMARLFSRLEDESGRLVNIAALSNFFRSVIIKSPDSLLACTYLAINDVGPAWEGLEVGVGDSILMKAISSSTGRTVKHIREEVRKVGDLGSVAESSRTTQRTLFAPKPLTVGKVLSSFRSIAKETKQDRKLNVIKLLLVASRECEARFIVRALQGNLRIGCSLLTVLPALARAVVLTPPLSEEDAAKSFDDLAPALLDRSTILAEDELDSELNEANITLRRAWCEMPSLCRIVPILLEHPIGSLLEHCHLTPGVPVKAMLAHPATSVEMILSSFENRPITLEFKYDGERAQIHALGDGSVRIFSRNLEDNTAKYPDLVRMLPKAFATNTASCIIDAEVVAFDKKHHQIQPFQVLSTRKRKDVEEHTVEVQVCIFAFDLLYLNGKSLLDEHFSQRRKLLRESFVAIEDSFMFASHKDTSDLEEITAYLTESVAANCEGLMVKALEDNSNYQPDKRSHAWFKLKKDYLEGAADTFDLVPIGAYYGKGKRTGCYGGFLLACYDPDSEQFQSLSKIGTGFSDEQLKAHTEFFKEHEIAKRPNYYLVPDKDVPDIWLDAKQVWEVKASDLSISPHHKAAIGLVDEEKGIALRFPRFVRIREDKQPEDSTTSEQVAEMYEAQANKVRT